MKCPNCEKDTLKYENANMSECETCGKRVPNVNLPKDND